MENLKNYLSFDDVNEKYGIPSKYIENYVKYGEELSRHKVGRKKLLLEPEFIDWYENRKFRLVELDKDDYFKCLDFALRSFYSYRSKSDFGTSQQRDAGKFITNFVTGKLGEIAVQKFFKKAFSIDIKLDFEIRDEIIGQDITEVIKPRLKNWHKVANPPNIRIGIKTTKMKNVWLVVPEKEVTDEIRKSDIYILSRVDLHLNHMLRILKEHIAFKDIKYIIPEFENILGEVVGFIEYEELVKNPPVTQIPKPKQDIQLSYIAKTGILKNKRSDWKSLIDKL